MTTKTYVTGGDHPQDLQQLQISSDFDAFLTCSVLAPKKKRPKLSGRSVGLRMCFFLFLWGPGFRGLKMPWHPWHPRSWHGMASNTGSCCINYPKCCPCFFFFSGVMTLIFSPSLRFTHFPVNGYIKSHVSRTMEAAVLRAECELFLQGAEPSWWK